MKTSLLLITTALFITNSPLKLSSVSKTVPSVTITKTQSAEFAFLRTHRQGKAAVTATWGLTSTDGVVGFTVQRTYQDPSDPYSFWEDVTSITCDPLRSFKYTDENVFPGDINYRIIAEMTDGTSIVSEVSGIKIVSKRCHCLVPSVHYPIVCL